MKVMITRKNGNLSDSLKDYIEKKVSDLDRYFPNVLDAHVIIDSHGRENSVEITMRVARRMLVSKLSSSNLRASIDGCVEKLDKQLVKMKGRYRRRGRKPGEVPAGLSVEASELDIDEDNLTLLTIERGAIILEGEERTGTTN